MKDFVLFWCERECIQYISFAMKCSCLPSNAYIKLHVSIKLYCIKSGRFNSTTLEIIMNVVMLHWSDILQIGNIVMLFSDWILYRL